MIRNLVFCIALLALLFSAGSGTTASAFGEKKNPKNDASRLKKKSAQKVNAKSKAAAAAKDDDVKGKIAKREAKVYVSVIIYDIVAGGGAAFETAVNTSTRGAAKSADFINERLLKNIDELASQYATYAKFTTRRAAEEFAANRLAAVKTLCTRTPETHLAEMTAAYFGRDGYTKTPTGMEYGTGIVGQVAHLGFFIPFPKYRELYESTLDEVKLTIQKRNPSGYFGEDVMVETDAPAPEAQAPYTPRASVPAQMSINYGEYNTFENAEDSYIARNEPRNDPKIVALQRNFFSALQVPTRFYIFKVIANIDGAQRKENVKTAVLTKPAK